jgi:Ca2+-binding RTX toxin-like protein
VGSGKVTETGASGHDTINLGFGNDTVYAAGNAAIHGEFGSASVSGGGVTFTNSGYGTHTMGTAVSGNVTLIGGEYLNQFVGGSGSTVMKGGLGPDTFVGGSGHDTMTGGTSSNLFEFLSTASGGQHVITNFVAGQDQLYLEGQSLSYLQSHNDISVSHGNTFISLDGGSTTIELKGFTGLTSSNVTIHK